ncbi:hypothetical protein [Micromonospora sp. NBC_01638]|uniref:hypothetical protein n=1 Tax=Micromonospora sp. NBC_01638 TaxID=2975982 RepID=UPI0038638A8A|nr:hypothetical protein OG811_16270 [Micromonospora sp. NBC_01638]
MFERITPDGVVWADGRFVPADVILADERVHLVGYGPSASTIGANRADRAAVNDIRAWLAPAAALD